MLRRFVNALLVLTLTAVSTACDSFTSPEDEFAGPYQASMLVSAAGTITFENTGPGDIHPDLELVLHEDGTTTGFLFLPNGLGGGAAAISADLAGSWEHDNDRVTLDLVTSSFLDTMFFNLLDDGLIGISDSLGLTLTLQRQD